MYHKSLDLDSLVGCTIESAIINDNKDIVILTTDKGKFFLTFVGSCCAKCFLANVNGANNLISTITKVESSEWIKIYDDYGCEETMGVKFTTLKGYVDFETRVEHNGYYGGWIQVSKEGPLNQYNDMQDNKEDKFVDLKDF